MIYTFEQIQNIPKTAGVYSIVNILNCARGKYNKMYGFKWRIKNDK